MVTWWRHYHVFLLLTFFVNNVYSREHKRTGGLFKWVPRGRGDLPPTKHGPRNGAADKKVSKLAVYHSWAALNWILQREGSNSTLWFFSKAIKINEILENHSWCYSLLSPSPQQNYKCRREIIDRFPLWTSFKILWKVSIFVYYRNQLTSKGVSCHSKKVAPRKTHF